MVFIGDRTPEDDQDDTVMLVGRDRYVAVAWHSGDEPPPDEWVSLVVEVGTEVMQ